MGYRHIDEDLKNTVLEAVRINGMPVSEASKKYGVHQTTISHWLRNEKYNGVERKNPEALTESQKEWLRRMPKDFKARTDYIFLPDKNDQDSEIFEYNNEMAQEILAIWPKDVDGYFLEPETEVWISTERTEHAEESNVDLDSDVSNPSHYTSGDIECIDAIRSTLGDEGFIQYLHGNVMKYIWRYDKKGFAKKDLEKAVWYISKIISMLDD